MTFLPLSFLIVRTRVAYVREFCVSSMFPSVGDTLTNMSVLQFPPIESLSNIVNLWLRYGMCGCSDASAEITSPSAESDLLIACASLSVSPSAPDFFTRSLPAKSTNESLPFVIVPVCESVVSMTSEKIRCDRLDSTFILVPAVLRTFKPVWMTSNMSSSLLTSVTVAFGTVTQPFVSFLMSSFGASPAPCGRSRSINSSR
mmetsp:Transcript_4419/g.16182  ORF Transcript_4419/g.16182 Transcript_4419/m.16182 type:complete len:201 (-) Transcript_4419:3185-3787(-)